MRPIEAKIGERHGRLAVLGRAAPDKRKRSRFECRCDCGTVLIVRANSLRTKTTKSCGCLKTESSRNNVLKYWMLPPGEAARRSLLSSYKAGAKKRHLTFALNEEQFNELVESNCFYCAIHLAQTTHNTRLNGQFTYNGIDRVDNSKGYTVENCVTCCRRCNWAKGTLSKSDFLNQVKRIVEYQHSARSYITDSATNFEI